jgi:hypothetical protein
VSSGRMASVRQFGRSCCTIDMAPRPQAAWEARSQTRSGADQMNRAMFLSQITIRVPTEIRHSPTQS